MKLLIISCLLFASALAQTGNYSGNTPIRGVNLGGWFVLEPWITPSIFYEVGNLSNSGIPLEEWEVHEKLVAALGYDEAKGYMSHHWGTFFRYNDFVRMKSEGVTHVRMPIPYWSVDIQQGEPFIEGNWEFILQAMRWMCDLDLKILLDLHTAPGSQNGFDNGGHCFGECFSHAYWGTPDDQGNYKNITRTYKVWDEILSRVQDAGVCLWGVEVINEPAPWWFGLDVILNYYEEAYNRIRQKMGDDLVIVFQEAFSWGTIQTFFPQAKNVMIDRHMYIMFQADNYEKSIDELEQMVCDWGNDMTAVHPVFTGEWAGAHTDCAYWLNGVGRGTRYEGTIAPDSPVYGDCNGVAVPGMMSIQNKTTLARLTRSQVHSFEHGDNSIGWFLWTARPEREVKWDFMWMSEQGIFDYDESDKMCSNTKSINAVYENQAGSWGGSCTCPNGQVYMVGDNYNSCGSLACVNGKAGDCNKSDGDWSGRKVICGDA